MLVHNDRTPEELGKSPAMRNAITHRLDGKTRKNPMRSMILLMAWLMLRLSFAWCASQEGWHQHLAHEAAGACGEADSPLPASGGWFTGQHRCIQVAE